MGFRTIATKNGVSEQWTGSVETTIIDRLKEWGEWEESKIPEFTMNGLTSVPFFRDTDVSPSLQSFYPSF